LYARSTSTKSNSVRVECPMVKAVGHLMSMFWQRAGSPGFGCVRRQALRLASRRRSDYTVCDSCRCRGVYV